MAETKVAPIASRLRASILQQAVQGRLVPQDPSEGTAYELLERIREERAELVKQKRTKKPKGSESRIYRGADGSWYEQRGNGETVCIDDEISFDIPETWAWTRLGSFVNWNMGQSPDGQHVGQINHGVEFHQGKTQFREMYLGVSPVTTDEPKKIAPSNSVLLCVRAPVGKVNITPREICIGRGLCSLQPLDKVNVVFLFYWMTTHEEHLNKMATGSTFKAVNKDQVNDLLLPVPPLAEQRRIVERINEIMPLIDQLEIRERARDAVDSAFWRMLPQSILQQAVEGKLVPRDADDEPACALLERIREERRELVKQKKAKAPKGGESRIYRGADGSWYEQRGKSTPVCIDEEIPFDIPESWEWARLDTLGSGTSAGKSPKCKPIPRTGDEWGVIKTTAVQDGRFLDNENKVLPAGFIVTEQMKIHEGDLLITRAGPRNRTGVVCVVDHEPVNLILSDKTVRIDYWRGLVHPQYIRLAISSSIGKRQIDQSTSGMAASQVNVSQGNIQHFLVPVPPLAEQQRIVAKVDEFLNLIDGVK